MILKEQKELFRKRVGKILEQRRMEKGLTRKELGELLGYNGDSAIQVVARFEAGRAGVPKAKIDQLLEILEIENKDFGLSTSKSLNNFITAGSFLGTTMVPWGGAMVDFLETTESTFVRQAITDEGSDEEHTPNSSNETYQDLLRLLRLYRASKETHQLSLIDKIDLIDTLAEGDEQQLAELFALLKIDATNAYTSIENHLLKQLKSK